MKKRLGSVAILISIVLGGAVIAATGNRIEGTRIRTDYTAKAEQRPYTILLYMNGSDLESLGKQATKNLRTMQETLAAMGKDADKLHLVAEVGGTDLWHTEGIGSHTRFTVTGEGITDTEEISPRSMGHLDSLTDFISYGMRSYPADKTILLFWNHGGGAVTGFGYDELHRGDSLTLPEIERALSHKAAAGFHCEMIGFDACLMATAETASLLRPWSKYLTASQELEPAEGWDYRWLEALADPELDGVAIGREIAQRYVSAKGNTARTLSVIDLRQMPELERCISQSFSAIDSEPEYAAVSEVRLEVIGYGGAERGIASDIVDLWSLAQAAKVPEPDALSAALARAVPVNLYNETANGGCGLTVYLPSGADSRLSEHMTIYSQTGFAEGYRRFVSAYASYVTAKEGYDASFVSVDWEDTLIVAQFDDLSNMAGVYLTVFMPVRQGQYALLYTDSDVTVNPNGAVSASFDWLGLYLNDQLLCSIERSMTRERLDCMSPILLNDQPAWLMLYFDRRHPYGDIAGVQPMDNKPVSTPLRSLTPGDIITPLYPLESFTEEEAGLFGNDIYDGKYLYGEPISVSGQNDLLLERMEIEQDLLLCGFTAVDLCQQQSYTEFAEIEQAILEEAA